MLANPMDVLSAYPVRKTKRQKQAFRDAVQLYAEKQGYPVAVEKGSFGARNVVIGDPEKARYLVTAHYDTCARMILPNWITPCNIWLYLGYQLLLVFLIYAVSVAVGLVACFGVMIAYGFLAEVSETAVMAQIGTNTFAVVFPVVWVLNMLLLIFGPANQHNANDNTSGVVTLLEIARTMPENQRNKVCFVLFDLEEAGLIGSASYRKAHKAASNRQMVLNLDCVGDGDHIRFFPTKKLKKDRKKLTSLYRACGYFGKKDILVQEKGLFLYPSDQSQFPYGVGICALKKTRLGLAMGKIHTSRDTTLDEINVNILRAALTTFICCDEVN